MVKCFRGKFWAFLLAFIMLVPLLAVTAETPEPSAAPDIPSSAVVSVYNPQSGQFLFTQNADKQTSPGAITKLLTMMVVADLFTEHKVDPSTLKITATPDSLAQIGPAGDLSAPRLGLTPGDEYLASDLMDTALISNANDSISILAHYCATDLLKGSLSDFLQLMNQKAKDLGAVNSVFTNITGLVAAAQKTTPREAALIAAGFFGYNDLMLRSKKISIRFNGTSTIHTKNYLLSDSLLRGFVRKDAMGMIAGQTYNDGGYMLASAVEKDGLSYIFVVMEASGEIRDPDGKRSFGDGNAYSLMHKLMDWGPISFGYKTLWTVEEIVDQLYVPLGKGFDYVSVVAAEPVERLINKTVDVSLIERVVEYNETVYDSDLEGKQVKTIDAPVSKNQVVGTIRFLYEGEQIAQADLVTQISVDASGMLSSLRKIQSFLFGGVMRVVLIVFAVLIAAYVLFALVAWIIRIVKRIRRAAAETRSPDQKPKSGKM